MSTLGSGHSNSAATHHAASSQPVLESPPAPTILKHSAVYHGHCSRGVTWLGEGSRDVLSFCHSLLIDEENYFDLVSVSIKLSVNFN